MKVKRVKNSKVYHTRDCMMLNRACKSVQEWDIENAKEWGFEHCEFC